LFSLFSANQQKKSVFKDEQNKRDFYSSEVTTTIQFSLLYIILWRLSMKNTLFSIEFPSKTGDFCLF
ncbi:MAG: hypothetical protein IJD33_00115, partial [Clostridia bacterium]|nr:hypothetical protein [Clostridia bacterium]